MRAPKPTLRFPMSVDHEIRQRVDLIIPSRQSSARDALYAMLRAEYGEKLEITGESAIARACEMVKNWRPEP